MTVNHIVKSVLTVFGCFVVSTSVDAQSYGQQSYYVGTRQNDALSAVKEENKQLKNHLIENTKEHKRVLKELEKAQRAAEQCNNYVPQPTYGNGQIPVLQNNNYAGFDEYSYNRQSPAATNTNTAPAGTRVTTVTKSSYPQNSYPQNNNGNSTYYQSTTTTVAPGGLEGYVPQNALQEQQLKEIQNLENTLRERKEAQERQQAQLEELNKKLDELAKNK